MKKLPQLILGHWIYTLGISFIILANMGAGSWDSVFIALTNKFGWTIGTWSLILQVSLIFFTALFFKEKIQWKAFYGIILGSIAIDFWMELIFKGVIMEHTYIRILMFAIGIMVVGFGIATYIRTNVFSGPIDGLMLAVSRKFKLSLKNSRLLIEFCVSAVGFIIGGPVGIGTLIVAITLGYCIQGSMDLFDKLKNKYNLTAIY